MGRERSGRQVCEANYPAKRADYQLGASTVTGHECCDQSLFITPHWVFLPGSP
jgi:hypothetical protein